jgi:cysteinyl-tRNA synthetase
MLQTHYRAPLDFSFDRLDGAVSTLERLVSCVKNLRWAAEAAPQDGHLTEADRALGTEIDKTYAEFTASMDDDFNTAGGLAAIFGLVTSSNKYLSEAAGTIETAVTLRAADALVELCGVLGIDLQQEMGKDEELPSELVSMAAKHAGYAGTSPSEAADALLAARQEARAAKNWGLADAIRDGIAALDLVVEDTAAGARLRTKKD